MRQSLGLAEHVQAYAGAAAKSGKFCHGFGLFQRDLQFFLDDPQYFLNKDYEQFDQTLGQALGELKRVLKKLDFDSRASRSTGILTKLQTEVDQSAVGVIVARRLESNRPGHIAIVVPEAVDRSAKRNTAGEVVAPLQSQAGAENFRYGTGKTDWWRGMQFAEFSFWLHA